MKKAKKNELYLVEIIRYGSTKLGVYPFAVFENRSEINEVMKDYNVYRGGKYPEYFISKIQLNPNVHEDRSFLSGRERYDMKGQKIEHTKENKAKPR